MRRIVRWFAGLGIIVLVLIILSWIFGSFHITFPSVKFSAKDPAKTSPFLVNTPNGPVIASVQHIDTHPVPTIAVAPSSAANPDSSSTTPGSSTPSNATPTNLGDAGEGDVCLGQSKTESEQSLGSGSTSTAGKLNLYFNLNEAVQSNTPACFNASITNGYPFTISQLTVRLDESFDNLNWGSFPKPTNTDAPNIIDHGNGPFGGYHIVFYDVKPRQTVSIHGYVIVPPDQGGHDRTCMRTNVWVWTPAEPVDSTPDNSSLNSNSDCSTYVG